MYVADRKARRLRRGEASVGDEWVERLAIIACGSVLGGLLGFGVAELMPGVVVFGALLASSVHEDLLLVVIALRHVICAALGALVGATLLMQLARRRS